MAKKQKIKWHKYENEKGKVFFKKHPSRKHGVPFDQYFRGEYQYKGKRVAINFGWISETGWSGADCTKKLKEYKKNAKEGLKPTSLREERGMKIEKELDKEKKKQVKEKSKITIDDYFKNIYYPKIQKEKKPKTYQREESLFRNWIDINLGEKIFKDVTKGDIESIFYDIVESGKSIRSAEYALTTLKQIWREAKNDGYAPDMPVISKTLRDRISQNNNARIRFLSHSEADLLLKELKKRSIDLFEKALISLDCGFRAKEIFTLTWSRVDTEHGIFNILDSKGKDRSVHMPEQVKEVMRSKIKGNLGELVFPGRENKVSGQISQVYREVANKLFNHGVDDRRERVTFHTLRHTCASWMVMQGISLYLVQKVLGHSTIQVTERYAHLAPDQLKLAANAIDKAVKKYKEKNIIPFKQKA